ncbi:hypothetical protein [Actinomadura atramentaria]|uniref:hypothetical protein n=1 Tax=Actinomadura atramentaria TaxID=1990 RepID=UPI00039F7DA2|nr:hypothetical protein [Actinomadura atramentaria]
MTPDDMTAELRRAGSLSVPARDDAHAAALRQAGRAAGRKLGRPVITRAGRGVVHVALTDWPANELEARLSESRANNALDRAGWGHHQP